MPAAVVKDGTVMPKFRQGKISPLFLTAKFSPGEIPPPCMAMSVWVSTSRQPGKSGGHAFAARTIWGLGSKCARNGLWTL